MNLTYSFGKMTEPQAREILSWRYEAPYDFYDPDEADFEDDLADMLEPANLYLAVSDENDALIGYYCFGREAQVAGGDYSEEVWDVGTGRWAGSCRYRHRQIVYRNGLKFRSGFFSSGKSSGYRRRVQWSCLKGLRGRGFCPFAGIYARRRC